MKTKNDILFTVMPADGNLSVVPEERSCRIRFYGLDQGVNPAVSVDGADIRDFAAHYEKEKGICLPSLPGSRLGKIGL